jgi:hypothetical protein
LRGLCRRHVGLRQIGEDAATRCRGVPRKSCGPIASIPAILFRVLPTPIARVTFEDCVSCRTGVESGGTFGPSNKAHHRADPCFATRLVEPRARYILVTRSVTNWCAGSALLRGCATTTVIAPSPSFTPPSRTFLLNVAHAQRDGHRLQPRCPHPW